MMSSSDQSSFVTNAEHLSDEPSAKKRTTLNVQQPVGHFLVEH